MSRHDTRDPDIGLREKARIRRAIDRVWAPYLTPAETKVVGFIFTTTVEWSKPQDRLKVDHFINGFRYAGGIGLSDKTIRMALNDLERDGAISRKRTPYGYVITLILDWDPAAVRLPRTRAAVSRKTAVEAPAPRPITLAEPREIGKTFRPRSVESSGAYRGENTRENIPLNRPADDGAPVKIKDKTSDKARKAPYVDPLDIRNIRAAWNKARAEAFPDITASTWTAREEGQAKLFFRVDDKTKRFGTMAMFDWCIRSWRTIIAARFSWMKERVPPVFPEIGFLLAFKGHFYDAWNDKERLRSEITMNGKDRRVRQLMHRGMSFEEAQKAADDGDALAQARIAVAEKERKLNEMLRRSEARGKPTLPERLARASNPGAWKAGTLRACPVRPGREGMTPALDAATLGAFRGGF